MFKRLKVKIAAERCRNVYDSKNGPYYFFSDFRRFDVHQLKLLYIIQNNNFLKYKALIGPFVSETSSMNLYETRRSVQKCSAIEQGVSFFNFEFTVL